MLITPVLPAAGLHLPVPRRLVRPGGQPHRRPAGARRSTATSSTSSTGRLILGDLYSVVKVEGTGEDGQDREGTSCTAPASTSTAPSPGSTRCSRRTDGDHEARRGAASSQARRCTRSTGSRSARASSAGSSYFLFRKVPGDSSWWHTLGSATLTAFLVQLVTGVILAMYYKPSPAEAHSSVEHITHDLWGGWLVRGMHRWGASVFIILMFMHMGRVFLFGAYKYPRELNWIVGVLLLATGLFEGLTGYLLPFDQTAYWATVVGGEHQRDRAVCRAVPRDGVARWCRDRARHAQPLLLDPHAARPRRADRADRPAPVPGRPPGRHARRRGRRRPPAASPTTSRRRRAPASSTRPARRRRGGPPNELTRRAPRRVPALQGGRQEAGQAVLPVRDVPRHGHEPGRRDRDRRARGRLEDTTTSSGR